MPALIPNLWAVCHEFCKTIKFVFIFFFTMAIKDLLMAINPIESGPRQSLSSVFV